MYENQKAPVKKDDFMYLPINIKHGMANTSNRPVRLLVMGFKIPQGTNVAPTAKLMLANAADVKLVPVQGHGPTSLFKLLMGTTQSTRDKLSAANQMVSLFIMDFAPGGTIFRTITIPRGDSLHPQGPWRNGGGRRCRWERRAIPGQRGRCLFHPAKYYRRVLQWFQRGRRSTIWFWQCGPTYPRMKHGRASSETPETTGP